MRLAPKDREQLLNASGDFERQHDLIFRLFKHRLEVLDPDFIRDIALLRLNSD